MSEDQKVWIPCPYLNQEIVLTLERREHILEEHDEVFDNGDADIKNAIQQPDQIRQRPTGSLLFVTNFEHGFLIVAVNKLKRENIYKIMTAYFARQLSGQDVMLWEKSK
jgi:hypothetical protein